MTLQNRRKFKLLGYGVKRSDRAIIDGLCGCDLFERILRLIILVSCEVVLVFNKQFVEVGKECWIKFCEVTFDFPSVFRGDFVNSSDIVDLMLANGAVTPFAFDNCAVW